MLRGTRCYSEPRDRSPSHAETPRFLLDSRVRHIFLDGLLPPTGPRKGVQGGHRLSPRVRLRAVGNDFRRRGRGNLRVALVPEQLRLRARSELLPRHGHGMRDGARWRFVVLAGKRVCSTMAGAVLRRFRLRPRVHVLGQLWVLPVRADQATVVLAPYQTSMTVPCSDVPMPPFLPGPDSGFPFPVPAICDAGSTCLSITSKMCVAQQTAACAIDSDCPSTWACQCPMTCGGRAESRFPPERARAQSTRHARRLAWPRIRTSWLTCALAPPPGRRTGAASRRRRRSPSEQPTRAHRGRVRHQGPPARPAREDARSVGRRRRLAGAWVPSQRSCGPHVAGLDDDVDRHGRRVRGDGSGRTNLRRSVKPADGPTNPSRTPSFRMPYTAAPWLQRPLLADPPFVVRLTHPGTRVGA